LYSPPNGVADDHSELFIALVAAVGVDTDMVAEEVATELAAYRFEADVFRLSNYLADQAASDFRNRPFDERVWAGMDEGDRLRERWDRNDALILHAVSDIVATREEKSAGSIEIAPGSEPVAANLVRHAFIIRSLKTPDEVETLRAIYGPRLLVIGAYSPSDKRVQHLTEHIEATRHNRDQSTWVHSPQALMDRDEKEEIQAGQDVSGTFHRSDFFIRAWDRYVARADLQRALEILFGAPFRTPTRDEYAQFQAAGAALRSAELGRQVGAAITNTDGAVIALGTNEVPQYGGGSHWEDDPGSGNRDFELLGFDSNRKHLEDLADQVAREVEATLHELAATETRDLKDLPERTAEKLPGALREGALRDLTEFGRAVHAEMDALLDAVRRGVSVNGATLHATTFPCHNCTRHIIGAGIQRVVFIEPYSKSRAETLHGDSVRIAESDGDGQLDFQPFVGVAPRRYLEMFEASTRERLGGVSRKSSTGKAQTLVKTEALPIFADAGLEQFRPELPAYRAKELLALEHFDRLIEEDHDEAGTPRGVEDVADTTSSTEPDDKPDSKEHNDG
jgi:deoxycytidylate deaminase